ncbi:hypothetical protein GCM10022255_115110 [Dactylosporangium darangshiense]|uniref:Uncharacterized protein n=1 Tax=Dactylosporangium darangshiense TaxID=579108 RepID=A0ABP8DWC3_9ACTN
MSVSHIVTAAFARARRCRPSILAWPVCAAQALGAGCIGAARRLHFRGTKRADKTVERPTQRAETPADEWDPAAPEPGGLDDHTGSGAVVPCVCGGGPEQADRGCLPDDFGGGERAAAADRESARRAWSLQ